MKQPITNLASSQLEEIIKIAEKCEENINRLHPGLSDKQIVKMLSVVLALRTFEGRLSYRKEHSNG